MQYLVYLQIISNLARAALIKREHLVTEVFVEENFTYDVLYAANKTSSALVGTEIYSFTSVVDLDATTLDVFTTSLAPSNSGSVADSSSMLTAETSNEFSYSNITATATSDSFTSLRIPLTTPTSSTDGASTSESRSSISSIESISSYSSESIISTPSDSSSESYSTDSSSVSSEYSTLTSSFESSTLATSTSSSATTTSSTTSSSSTSSSSATVSTSTTSPSSTESTSIPTDEAANDYNSSDFENDILYEHNVKRALHGVQSLTWNTTLEAYAQAYADDYSCPSNGELIHSGGPYGENLASGYSSSFKTVDAWYDEISDYDFSNPGFTESTGHFTQLVWKDTAQLGCAYKSCDTAFHTYVICSYYPAGNVIGYDWSEEVPQPL